MKYHFIGLGGIGMSALARILLQKGAFVQGSDQASSALLKQLELEGAQVCIGHRAELLEPGMTVVYSSDIKETNVEWQRAEELGLCKLHRSQLLDQLIRGQKGLLVTGTHGKTTTSALLASTLLAAGSDPSFVVGGILRSLGTNGKGGNGPYFVAEADESDGSFLRTPSLGAIVTNLENEHLNYWGTPEQLDLAFKQFFEQVQQEEHLFWCGDDSRLCSLYPKGNSYGFSKEAALRIDALASWKGGMVFDCSFQGKFYKQIELTLMGRHNVLNAAAVFGLCLSLKIPEEKIRSAFQTFSGTARRLEWKGEARGITIYDDYGHHPTEIAATLNALRSRTGPQRLIALFQPHRFTRVRDLFEEFTTCFTEADEVVMTDIYSAGEAPIEGITTEAFRKRLKEVLGAKLSFIPRASLESEILSFLRSQDVVLTLGAGDVTKVGESLLRLLEAKA